MVLLSSVSACTGHPHAEQTVELGISLREFPELLKYYIITQNPVAMSPFFETSFFILTTALTDAQVNRLKTMWRD